MELPQNTNTDWLSELRGLLLDLHAEAVAAHIRLEVMKGVRDSVFLSEFEHALSHKVKQIIEGENTDQLEHIRSHLCRIVVEAHEYVAEEYLVMIHDQLEPYSKHPLLARILFVPPPKRADEFHRRMDEIRKLIMEGRNHKGHNGIFEVARDRFKQAADLAVELDKDIPLSRFYDRYFSLLLASVFFVLGFLTRWIIG